MCVDPVTAAVVATTLSAASSGLEFFGQAQEASFQRNAANVEAVTENNALTSRSLEIEESTSGDILSSAIEELRIGGAIAVGAAEGGLSSLGQFNLAQGANAQLGRETFQSQRQGELELAQVNRDLGATESRRSARIAANQGPGPLQLIGGVVQAGLAGFNAYNGAVGASQGD